MAAALRVLRCVSSYLPIGAPARAERGSDNPGTTQIVGPGASAGGLMRHELGLDCAPTDIRRSRHFSGPLGIDHSPVCVLSLWQCMQSLLNVVT